MSIKKSLEVCEGVQFIFIKDDKFKTSRISFNAFLPLEKHTASKNAILPSILERSCKKYPNFEVFNKYLESLYSSSIFSNVEKIGESQVLSICVDCIKDTFSLDKKPIVNEAADLLCNVIFDPNIENNAFNKNDVFQEKRQLSEIIDSEFNDKRIYAKRRCEQLMCKDENFGVNKYGSKEDVKNIVPEDVFDTWKYMLQSANIKIIMIGDSPYEPVYKMFKEHFIKLERKNIAKINTQIIEKAAKTYEYSDSMDVIQCKLVMGFRTGVADPDKNAAAMRFMTTLLGGTPHSKLFLNVREKLSLCYYCSSGYDKHKGIMLIESGVELKNIDKAKEEILKQIEDIKNNNFDDNQFEATKMALIQSYQKMEDSISSIDSWYAFQPFTETIKSTKEAVKEIENVTREDVVAMAKKLTLDTVYTLKGNGDE